MTNNLKIRIMRTIEELVKMSDLEHERGLKFLNNGQLEKYSKSYKAVTELNSRIEILKSTK
tara:strand:+ start:2902 stop:3084 length:183 start_codon:yes stop_codon:yes gene_type:complete